ncbi:hypothetical protein ACJRO7_011401 [Eucalyptus globulus]|uniref:Uncharacterized protein n=1 Tax=Eucalyptus globulus TaxID=34317 RepID=A0ABD3LFZ0_EUCGL
MLSGGGGGGGGGQPQWRCRQCCLWMWLVGGLRKYSMEGGVGSRIVVLHPGWGPGLKDVPRLSPFLGLGHKKGIPTFHVQVAIGETIACRSWIA